MATPKPWQNPKDPVIKAKTAEVPVSPLGILSDTKYEPIATPVGTATSTIREGELLLNERTLVPKDAILDIINS